ncbi:MAG: TatD family hydrolase [Chitinophagaceae bacterium]
MNLIDSHAHIYSAEFDKDRTEAIQRSINAGIVRIIMPAIDSSTHESMLRVENAYPETCMSMMGLHPCSVKKNYEEELQIAEKYLQKQKFIGVGETGLDFYWDISFKDQQYAAFNRQLEWALQYDIPVSIHSRNATDECIRVIQQHQKGKLRGVFHCFSGTQEQAGKLIELGFYLGIGGVLTFKNAGLDHIVKQIDLSNILLETDSPYLAPVPFRGKRNECNYITYISQKLADINEMPVDMIAAITTANAKKLFGL